MKDYLFILGRDIELGLLELVSYLSSYNIKFNIKKIAKNVLLISIDNFNPKILINILGGTIKIGEVISYGKNIYDDLDKINFEITGNKINYSLSAYNNPQSLAKVNDYFKKRFRNEGIKFSLKIFVSSDSPKKIKLEEKDGMDIILFSNYIAKTIALSNPISYKLFDQKPENDFLKSTSVRLSKILINLSQIKENDYMLDPFCGIGSIMQQALIRNINVTGIDNDQKSIYQTKKNLDWTSSKFKIKSSYKVIFGDSQKASKFLNNEKFNAVVTEPYLGPYIKKTLTKFQALKISEELEKLYQNFFRSLKPNLKRNSIIVIILPEFRTREREIIKLNINNIINNQYLIYSPYEKITIPIKFYGINKKIIRSIYILKNKY